MWFYFLRIPGQLQDRVVVVLEDAGALLPQVEDWHPCPHIPGCITVNIGDALQAYSDGLLKSNFHRVRMPKPDEPQVGCCPCAPRPSMHACMHATGPGYPPS